MNYEEVIKNVKELSNLAEWYESDVISNGYKEAKKHREDMTQRVIKFIEKEHELLGLYRKVAGINLSRTVMPDVWSKITQLEIRDKIYELNEEEMK